MTTKTNARLERELEGATRYERACGGMDMDHRYKGKLIRKCVWAPGVHDGHWLIQSYHQTGMTVSDELCPHFHTLSEAKSYITLLLTLEMQKAS